MKIGVFLLRKWEAEGNASSSNLPSMSGCCLPRKQGIHNSTLAFSALWMNHLIAQPVLIATLPSRPEPSCLFPSLVTFTMTDRASLPETGGSHWRGRSNSHKRVQHAPVTKTPARHYRCTTERARCCPWRFAEEGVADGSLMHMVPKETDLVGYYVADLTL